jgi:hypothetical protein
MKWYWVVLISMITSIITFVGILMIAGALMP